MKHSSKIFFLKYSSQPHGSKFGVRVKTQKDWYKDYCKYAVKSFILACFTHNDYKVKNNNLV